MTPRGHDASLGSSLIFSHRLAFNHRRVHEHSARNDPHFDNSRSFVKLSPGFGGETYRHRTHATGLVGCVHKLASNLSPQKKCLPLYQECMRDDGSADTNLFRSPDAEACQSSAGAFQTLIQRCDAVKSSLPPNELRPCYPRPQAFSEARTPANNSINFEMKYIVCLEAKD